MLKRITEEYSDGTRGLTPGAIFVLGVAAIIALLPGFYVGMQSPVWGVVVWILVTTILSLAGLFLLSRLKN